MKILITGGCGFLGHHIVEHFLRASTADIVVLDKLSYASAGFDRLRDIQAFDDKRVRILGCDVRSEIPEGIMQELGPIDYVIHAAAETHVDNSITNPLPFYETNVIGTHHLLWAFYNRVLPAALALRRIFVVSTDEVYGPAPWGHPGFDSGAAFRPANPYAAAKAGQEAVAMAYANTYKLPITIVNGMNFIGERQHPEKYVPKVIAKVLAGEKVTIHADKTKTQSGTRFYLHCRNFAAALDRLIAEDSRLDGAPLPAKVHIVGEKEISNLALAQLIADIVGKPLKYEMVDFHSSRPGHDLRYAMADDYLGPQLGFKYPLSIEESLEKTVRWYLDAKNARWLDWGSR